MMIVISGASSAMRSSTFRDRRGVDGGAGLVHQKDIGLHGKHTGDAHTLLLTARERQTILVELIGYLFPEVGA